MRRRHRLLGVETNITNWQRRQNANQNFSATVPYDMEMTKRGKPGVPAGSDHKGPADDGSGRDAYAHSGKIRNSWTQTPIHDPVSGAKPDVPDGGAEVSADGRDEYRAPDRREED